MGHALESAMLLSLLLSACAPEALHTLSPHGDTPAPSKVAAAERDVLIITVDTLRRDALGAFGGTQDTPFLDDLAERSLVLNDHSSCAAWTLASMTCFFSGENLLDLDYEPVAAAAGLSGIPMDFAGLPTWLRGAGYDTALIATNPLVSDKVPIGNGFDDIVRLDQSSEDSVGVGAEAVVDAALDWLLARGEDPVPLYLHLHLLDPHHPYQPPADWLDGIEDLPPLPESIDGELDPEALERALPGLAPEDQVVVLAHLRFLYNAEVRFLDSELERLFAAPQVQTLLEEGVVVFASDHGEAFWEHEALLHGRNVYTEVTGVPALIAAPGLTAGVWRGRTGHSNLAASVLELVGLPAPEGIRPTIWDRAPDAVRSVVRSSGGHRAQVAVDRGHHTLVFTWDGTLELFDTWRDPDQFYDLVDERPDVVAALWAELEPRVAQVADWDQDHEPVPPAL